MTEQTDNSHANRSPAGWQMMCELSVPTGPDRMEKIPLGLEEQLAALQLSTDLVARIAASIETIVERVMQTKSSSTHLHIFLFTPIDLNRKVGAWGFFWIEKLEGSTEDMQRNHAVELYLYPEGG
jgi:hypothetical protein